MKRTPLSHFRLVEPLVVCGYCWLLLTVLLEEGLVGRSAGKVGGVDVRPLEASGGLAGGVVLNLIGQLEGSLPGTVDSLSSVLLSNSTSLDQLVVGKVAVVCDLSVNGILVVDVDVWAGENHDGSDECKTPEWKVLDQEVAEE
jgi:hypothetical protein